MNTSVGRLSLLVLVILASAFTTGAVFAQDDEPEEDSGFYLEATAWLAQSSGLDLVPAVRRVPGAPYDTQLISLDPGTQTDLRWRLGYKIKDGIGDIIFTWYGWESTISEQVFTPAEFIWGEVTTAPSALSFAGAFDDGQSDGWESDAVIQLRDLRLDFYRTAFKNRRIHGKWFVGYRRASHNSTMTTTYYALAPNLPPILPPIGQPREDLIPEPDITEIESEFTARGVEAGFEISMPLWKQKIFLDAGFAVAALRGSITTTYTSTTHWTVIRQAGELIYVDLNDPDVFEDADQVRLMDQEAIEVGLNSKNESTGSELIETHLGFRWRAWRTLDVIFGIRGVFYGNMAQDLTVSEILPDADANDFFVTGIQRTTRGVNFEGYYLGVGYTF